ncbi:MAG: 6-phosphofructokinase [Actinomycetota bacterium]
MKKVAMLTGGGDSSGINDFIRQATRLLIRKKIEVLGIKQSYLGLLENRCMPLLADTVEDIAGTGGTILFTSRTNPSRIDGGYDRILENMEKQKIDALVCAGGNDTLSVAGRLSELGVKVIGVPQTIDNDLPHTDYCIGFHTAVANIVAAVRMITSSNVSHQKEMVVEVMGRDSGFLALRSAIALGADYLAIPEFELDMDMLCSRLSANRARGKKSSLIIVSEGVKISGASLLQDEVDVFGNIKLGGIAYHIAERIGEKIGSKPRAEVLGYVPRGGAADPYDSFLSTIFANGVADNIGRGIFGVMVGLCSEKPKNVNLSDATSTIRLVGEDEYKLFNG